MKARILLSFFLAFLLLSCQHSSCNDNQQRSDSTLTLQYAKGFSVDYFKGYKRVTVNNPWTKGAVYARYYLVKSTNVQTPSDGQKIVVPLSSYCATSGTQYEFLRMLGVMSALKGVCSPDLIYNQNLHKAVLCGKLANLGDPYNMNVERIAAVGPKGVFISGFNQADPVSKRLNDLRITVLFDNEWMETSLLARAEWMKFVAVFFDKERLADRLFAVINKNYTSMKRKALSVKNHPTVLCGGNFKGTWYVPGGRSYMAGLLNDAGADYFYKNDTSTGSLPLNFETVLRNFKNADCWIGSSASSYSELISMDERHNLFLAAQRKRVFNFKGREISTGGNDFWEMGVARPDLILADMIKIFHPELLPTYRFTFALPLK